MSDIPSENSLKQEPASDGESGQRTENNQDRPPTIDLTALIDTINIEGTAYRNEEQREDRGKARRERITIVLLFCTVIAIGWQVYKMVKVYGPIKDQAIASSKQAIASETAAAAATKQSENSDRTLIQSQRAWIGPTGTKIDGPIEIGKPINIIINYANIGRQPGLNFIFATDAFVATAEDENNRVSAAKVDAYFKGCRETTSLRGRIVVFPSTTSSSYLTLTKDNFIDQQVIDGTSLIIVDGCFLYKSFDVVRHTYFCYFCRAKQSKPEALSVCLNGHGAD